MGYPRTGELGKVNSATASTDVSQLFVTAMKHHETNLTVTGASVDVTGDGETTEKSISGLREWNVTFRGSYPKTAPKIGNTGLITYSAGYVQYVDSYRISMDFGEERITQQSGAPTWEDFMPSGVPSITFTYVARTVNDTALSFPNVPNATGDSATFKLCEDGASDPTISGLVTVQQLGTAWGPKGQMRANYGGRFTGDVTETAGSNFPILLGTSSPHVIVAPMWGNGTLGPNTTQIVMQSTTSRTYTGYCFIRTLEIECATNGAVTLSGSCRGIGALTPA